MEVKASPERLSVMLGLLVLMLATVPRYLAGGHDSRLTLILMAVAVVVAVCTFHWHLLPQEGRERLPALLRRLGVSLVAGSIAMGLWHALTSDWVSWQVLLSHGATLGLMLHALWLWRYPASR